MASASHGLGKCRYVYMPDNQGVHYICIQAPVPVQRRYYTAHVPDVGKNAIIAFRHEHHCRDTYDRLRETQTSVQILATTIASIKATACMSMHLPLVVVDNIYCDVDSKEVVQDLYLYQDQQINVR